MALPSLTLTQQFLVNQTLALSGTLETQTDNFLLGVKNGMKASTSGFTASDGSSLPSPTGGWTVWGSNNGAGAFGNGDGVDRWSAIGDIVHNTAGNNHSWIVLRQTGLASNAALLLDCNSATVNNLTMVFSPTGFGAANGGADGTATAAPTALNSTTLVNAGSTWGATSNASNNTVMHLVLSSDGTYTVIVFMRNNFVCGAWVFVKPQQVKSWWTTPILIGALGTATAAPASSTPAPADWTDTTGATFLQGRSGASNFNVRLGHVGFGNTGGTAAITTADPDNDNPLWGTRAVSNTANFVGDHAFIPDMWVGRNNISIGSGYPSTGNVRQFMQFDRFILPWNRSTIVLTA
jgi:hypothetical protein